ncbi:MAG: PPE domain-containing protein [Actinomycetia bacterium]|nr:PPE domain-containing protein [Actinomycetes bacterium]
MSGNEVRVLPEDLRGKAAQIKGLSWPSGAAQPAVAPPDTLSTTAVAITNLNVNAEHLWAYQEFGRLEGLRLAETLNNIAAAYEEVDELSGEDIDSKVGGSVRRGLDGTQYPDPVAIPAPPHPPDMPPPKGELVSEQLLFPPATQRALEAGDGGASLKAAARTWRANAESLAASAQQFETNSLDWEGGAADAAYAKFNAYRSWLISLSGSWNRLAGEADALVDAHVAARRDNEPVADEYEQLEQAMAAEPSSAENPARMVQMSVLQGKSEGIRNQYARAGQPRQIRPEDPPTPVVSGIPVTVDDHRRARGRLPQRPDQEPGQGAGGGGSPPAGGLPDSAERQAVPPMTDPKQATPGAPQEGSQGGSPGGGQPGGGSPGGGQPGGSPGGGQPGGGVPTTPGSPTGPSVRPAAAGGGSGAGAGGGGKAPSPLQPAVGAETVAPTPRATPGAPAAAAGGTPGMSGGMGGMGGMAPMMHGAKGEGRGDKKRNPQLSEDEELYTEDRPWTEAVIGNRPRRRSAPDGPAKESQ